MPEPVRAEVSIGSEGWAVTWRPEFSTPAYMVAQLSFEAKRAAERALTEESP